MTAEIAPTAWLFAGQGSQHKGMGGAALFAQFPGLVARADAILGYSIETLCLADPEQRLARTEFAQPALYVVNSLSHEEAIASGSSPQFYAGHSLGEYNALCAAGCFDFETGLRLVVRRGQLMGKAQGGGMAAVIGMGVDEVRNVLLPAAGAEDLDVANINSPTQVVVSGALEAIKMLATHARTTKSARVAPLAVSAAFHSRYMEPAGVAFAAVLDRVAVRDPRVPVISNTTGLPFPPGKVREVLSSQMRSGVRWWESLMTLRRLGVTEARTLGPGRVLSGFWEEARKVPTPSLAPVVPATAAPAVAERAPAPRQAGGRRVGATFCERHGVRLPYVSGSMYRGIASAELVIRMGRVGLLGFFGAGGLPLNDVERAITSIRESLSSGAPFGVNLLSSPDRPGLEQESVDLYLRQGVRFVEAAAFTQITAPLVEFRFRGASIRGGRAHAPNQVLAKLSRVEVARGFLSPPSEDLLRRLLSSGRLSESEVAAARRLPVAADVCIEADSGGHTDGGVALVLLPSMVRLRNQLAAALQLDEPVRIGAAGGLGSPEAIAAAFVLGAEFVVTGSINQCTPEAGTSSAVKELLSQVELHDTAYAPAGDMFEVGARVQVVKRSTLFAARANQLYQLYRTHDGLGSLPERTSATIERFMGMSLDEVWRISRARLAGRPGELARVEGSEKARMARVFKWYFSRSILSAMSGDLSDRVNFQVHCGPAMGAFNAFARGGPLESWRARHVDVIADELMARAEHQLSAER
jgi:trans-AT polyketide synthase/acyltransferase/oxidoreductase domain-containing protein